MTTPPSVRTLVWDPSGPSGSTYTPPTTANVNDRPYNGKLQANPSPSQVGLTYSGASATGSGSVKVSATPGTFEKGLDWFGASPSSSTRGNPPGLVLGIESIFKFEAVTGPHPWDTHYTAGSVTYEVDGADGANWMSTQIVLLDLSGSARIESSGHINGSDIDVVQSVTLDLSRWVWGRLLPTGDWSFAYYGGSTIAAGTFPDFNWALASAPRSPVGHDPYNNYVAYHDSANRDPNNGHTSVYVDRIWFWVNNGNSVVRKWPRDDALGYGSANRIHPAPKSGRIAGNYQ